MSGPLIRLSDVPDEPNRLKAPCNQITERHAGPIETTVVVPKPLLSDQQALADVCRNCGYFWLITWLTPERAEQYRRAFAEKRGSDPRRRP